jgi:hypothetical protein
MISSPSEGDLHPTTVGSNSMTRGHAIGLVARHAGHAQWVALEDTDRG